MGKLSFIQKLTGGSSYDDYDDEGFDAEPLHDARSEIAKVANAGVQAPSSVWGDDDAVSEDADGELPIDMYETDDSIVIQAFVAGVRPDDLEITITRDSVTIRGNRAQEGRILDEDYVHHELFWGSFARKVALPDEVIIDEADAQERHGLLQIVLPRLDKHRSARLNIKSTK